MLSFYRSNENNAGRKELVVGLQLVLRAHPPASNEGLTRSDKLTITNYRHCFARRARAAPHVTCSSSKSCLTVLGPAAAERQPSGAPATRSMAGGAAQPRSGCTAQNIFYLKFFEMGHIVRQSKSWSCVARLSSQQDCISLALRAPCVSKAFCLVRIYSRARTRVLLV